MRDLTLTTARLLLRPWRDADRAPLAAMCADPEVMEFFEGLLTRAESDALMDRFVQRFEEHGGWGWFVLEERASGDFLGFAGLSRVRFEAHFTPAVEIGWRLARAAWGHGYATEAAREAVRLAFDEVGVDEVVAYADPRNARSLAVMRRLGMTHDPADDFDHPEIPEDSPLRHMALYRLRAPRRGGRPRPASRAVSASPLVSILVPTLDEERELPAALDALAALPGRFELVVADGGSRDATTTLARAHAAAPRVIEARGGRAAQLNAAARVATGDVLLFLHADSRLPCDAYASLAEAWRTPGVVGGNFALRFDGDGAFERVLSAVYRFQRRHGFYYGDSSAWARREAFDALGGYREIPIMDDYDFVRRLERLGRTRCLPGPATTSARRWHAIGIPRTVLAWSLIRWLYVAGVSPDRLVRLYRVVR